MQFMSAIIENLTQDTNPLNNMKITMIMIQRYPDSIDSLW